MKVVYRKIKQRGGRVVIPHSEVRELSRHEMGTAVVDSTLVLSLKVPDGKIRSVDTYPSESLFRLFMALKYLIYTSPNQRMVVTNADLAIEEAKVVIDPSPESLIVLVDGPDDAVGRLNLIRGSQFVTFDGSPLPSGKVPN